MAPPVPSRSWKVVDADGFTAMAEETRGIREKQWVRDPAGGQWLRKAVRRSRPCECVVEWFTARLAAAVGLDAPETWASTWSTLRGVVVRRFGEDDEELVEGNALLARANADYDSDNKALHSLLAVGECLAEWEPKNRSGVSLRTSFAHLLAFDLWVGNGDRHQGNWGLLLRGPSQEARLAPIYDTAACLGAELGEEKLTPEWAIDRYDGYIGKCPSGFGDGTTLILLPTLASQLATWPEWVANGRTWHRAFATRLADVSDWLGEVPADWLSPARRKLMVELLRRRLDWMKGFLP